MPYYEFRNSTYVARAEQAVTRYHTNPEDVTASFLRCFWTHLREQAGQLLSPAPDKTFQFVITTPAAWPEEAQHAIVRAVKKGLDFDAYTSHQLAILSEPKAAALYIAKYLGGLNENPDFLVSLSSGICLGMFSFVAVL